MKRLWSLVIFVVMPLILIISLSGCGGTPTAQDLTANNPVTVEQPLVEPEPAPEEAIDFKYEERSGGIWLKSYFGKESDVDIPDTIDGLPVAGIGDNCFSDNKTLTSVTIPDGVTEIESYAFSGCRSLERVTIPDSVTKIGKSAFAYCESLINVTIPDGVTEISDYAFAYCSSITSATITAGVTKIGTYAFYYCESLADITIPDSVTEIGSVAFYFCNSLGDETKQKILQIDPDSKL